MKQVMGFGGKHLCPPACKHLLNCEVYMDSLDTARMTEVTAPSLPHCAISDPHRHNTASREQSLKAHWFLQALGLDSKYTSCGLCDSNEAP